MQKWLFLGSFLLVLGSCGAPKPVTPKPSGHAQVVAKPLDLSASTRTRSATTRIGQRTAFVVTVCTERQSPILLGELYAYLERQPGTQPPWIVQTSGALWFEEAASMASNSPPPNSDEETSTADDDSPPSHRDTDLHCTTLAGALNSAGPVTFMFARVPSTSSNPGKLVGRLPMTLPEPIADPSVLKLLGDLLVESAPADQDRRQSQAVASFAAFRAPAVYGTDSRPGETGIVDDNALYDVFAGAADLPKTVGFHAFARELDPDEPASVVTDSVVALEPSKLPIARWLHGRVPPVPEIVSRWVPRDAAVIRFQNLDKLLELLERGDELGSGLVMGLWRDARDHALRARYTAQLGLDLHGLKALAAKGMFDDIALLTHDGNLRDGTDISLILDQRASNSARQQLVEMLEDAAKRSGVRADSLNIAGHTVAVREAANHRLRSYAIFDGDWSLFSNSRIALERVLATHDGHRQSLANEPDYLYLATIGKQADGVIYAGQAFLDAEVGPARNVAHRRRLLCTAQMQLLSGAALAYKRDRGMLPNLTDLQSAHYLRDDDLHCPDGGTIALSNGAPACSVHGSLGTLNPVIEHLPGRIKPHERDEYLEHYRALKHTGQVLPVRIDLEVGAELVAAGHMLADPTSAGFQVYRHSFGPWPTKLATLPPIPSTLAALSLNLNLDDASPEQEGPTAVGGLLAVEPRLRATGPYAVNRWLTGQVGFFFQDGEPAVTFSFEDLDFLKSMTNPIALNALGAALTMPFYGTVTLKDRELAGRAMDMVLGQEVTSMPFFSVKRETYDLLPYRGIDVHVFTVHTGPIELHIYHALLGKEFVWSPRKSIILKVIDYYLDASTSRKAGDDAEAQSVFDVYPDAFQRARDTVETAWQERLRRACNEHLQVFDSLRQAYGAEQANNDDLARAHFGYAAHCPEGGSYRFDPLEGGATCSVHGRPGRARQPAHLSPTVESGRAIHPLDRVSARLTTTERTIESELRIHRH